MARIIDRNKKPSAVVARDWLPGQLYESVDNHIHIGTVKEKTIFGVDLTTGAFVFNPNFEGKVIQNNTIILE